MYRYKTVQVKLEATKEIIWNVWKGIQLPFTYFFDPSERINIVYLLSSLMLAYYVYYTSKKNSSFFKYIFNKKVWLGKSAQIDYKFIVFNGVLKVLLIIPLLESWRYLGYNTTTYLESFGLSTFKFSQTETLVYYTLSLVIIYDLVFYLVHLAMHKIPFLWEFHKIHHSATTMNPITQYRLHPIELIINNFAYMIVSSLLMGVFDYFSNDRVGLYLFFNANIFSALFLIWGASLRHSHVRLKYFNFLEGFFLSPYQHQIHHSDNPKHYDKNIGAKLALWDRLFGTLIRSKKEKNITFGLGGKEQVDYNSFTKNLYMPFIKNIKRIAKKIQISSTKK